MSTESDYIVLIFQLWKIYICFSELRLIRRLVHNQLQLCEMTILVAKLTNILFEDFENSLWMLVKIRNFYKMCQFFLNVWFHTSLELDLDITLILFFSF